MLKHYVGGFFNLSPDCSLIVELDAFVSILLSCLNLTPAASLKHDIQVLSRETVFRVPRFWVLILPLLE